MKSNRRIILGAVLVFIAHQGMAQRQQSGDIQDAEIVIEKDRQIELNKEVKLYEFIKWQPKPQQYQTVDPGEFEVFEYDLADEPEVIASTITTVAKKESEYHQYLKAGLGNYWSPLIDLSLVSPGDPNQSVGLNYKHLSFKTGEVDGDNSASALNEISVYGTKVWQRVKTTGVVSYKSDENYLYGYTDGTVVNREDIRKSNKFVSAKVEMEDNNLTDVWNYNLNAGYRGFFDNYDNAENTLDVDGLISNSNKIFLEAQFNLSNYNQATPSARSHLRAKPYYSFEYSGFKIDAGLSVNMQSDKVANLKQFKVFPYLATTYDLTDEYEVFAKLDAGYDFNTLYDFSDKVPYLNPDNTVANTEKTVDITAGVRGDITENWYSSVQVGYQGIRNLPMYVNSAIDQSLIDLTYDKDVTNLFTVGLTTEYEINKKHQVELGFTYYNYSGGDISQAYHLPATDLSVRGEHLFVDKLTFQWQYSLLAGITAYDAINDSDVDLSAISRLDLSVHYQIKERLGAFISSDNTIGKAYSRYLYYPQRGLQIKAGVTFRF
ncbi:hypothetical protein N6H18_13440 [Reichenbachiella agarivorans]|uniref:TonB dependent receptor n=1 Tax=Reichenbachiella agarivorans TaxID=2979464 RepID=A0ABY6CLG2_9BACT|nr:hypothetical protein [Reichenbachiella agarivorans]UXP31353.1 hypothetical protein N6H18_13440 [Reichenbachiella agarivorans]